MSTVVIRIDEADATGYPVRILVDGVDKGITGSIPVSLAAGPRVWTDQEIAGVMTASRSGVNLRDLGAYLFALLQAAGVTQEWLKARDASNGPFRTVLEIAPRKLQVLPWEVLFVAPGHIAVQDDEAIYRAVPSNLPHQHGDELPLRILAVVGAGEKDIAIGWREEVEGLRVLFRSNPEAIDLEVSLRPSRKELADLCKLFRPHIVHFIGHGGTSPSDEAGLQFADGNNIRWWTVTEIVRDLRTKPWRPRLLFLNACRTADAGAPDSTHDITRAAVADAGACCAIGMQADVPGADAAKFANIVYGALVAGRSVDAAVTKARSELEVSASDVWPLPVLQVACAPDVALPAHFPVSADVTNFRDRFRKRLSTFSDRQLERRQFWVDVAATTPSKRLIIVHGKESLGKSALMLWCVRHFALRGESVRYVNVEQAPKKDHLGFLDLLRHGDRTAWPVEGDLPDAPFAVFDARFQAPIPASEDAERELFNLFCDGLQTLTKTKPLLLVLDQFDFAGNAPFTAAVRNYIKPRFIDRIRAGLAGDVRLVLVMKQAEYESDEMADLLLDAHPLEVRPWKREDFQLVADEVFASARSKNAKFVDALIQAAELSFADATWTPSTLNPYIEAARKGGFLD